MGRAYEVRKASIMKTGAAKAKLYSTYAKEIYQAAKSSTDIEANPTLKRLVERAKKEQVPGDVIKRAIDKVNSGVDENYSQVTYELFGPHQSTLLVDCLTDNINRTISSVRTVINKCNIKMGALGSINYMYDHVCIVGVMDSIDSVMDVMIENDIDVIDIDQEDDLVVITAAPNLLFAIKNSLLNYKKDIVFELDEITKLPKDKITLDEIQMVDFNKLLNMLEEIEDVSNVYHNVEI
ncbi:MAG: YebC/PmpR family DNA-binding transcriptional regulator [Mycoplasmatota bacterium]